MVEICIIFSPDSKSWFNYFENYLLRVFPDIVIEPCEESCLLQLVSNSSKTGTAMNQSKVNIFIISPGYLQFCIENPEVTLKDSGNNAKVIIFLCATTLDDFAMEDVNGQTIADRLPVFEKQCLLSYPQHHEMLEKVVGMIEPEHRSSSASISRKGDKPKPNGKRKRRSKGFKFIPREVNCEGTSDVIISFDELDGGEESEIKVELEIDGDAESECLTRIAAVYVNPYTCSFRAPERRAGVVKVCVYLQGKALGTEELTYSSPVMDAISGIHQIYIRQINELCSLLRKDQLPELDRSLALLLLDESKGLIPTKAFEYFHKVHRFQSSDVSEFELPTVFHLAAKYGLRELCKQFTDFPDARYSFCTYNVDQKLPEDLAKSTNHPELANMLETLRESDTFQKLYDSYIIMNRGDLSLDYLRQSSRTGGSDDDYEDVPTADDMSEMSKQRFKYGSTLKSDVASGGKVVPSQIDNEGENNSSCSFVDKYLQPVENPYDCRILIVPDKLLAPVKFIEGKAATPRNQQELIHIMEQVKNKQLTMADAEVLFKEWKIRHQKKPASVKHKEDQLAKLREETGKANKKKKETFHFSQLLGKKSGGSSNNLCVPEIMPGAKKQPEKPSVDGMGDRTSTASSCSRESSCSIQSRTSTTSGIDIDETIQEEVNPKLHPKPKHGNRKSIHLQKLAIELTSPGALAPPSLPSRPSIPLPRLERAASPRHVGRNTNSPDRPCLSTDVEPCGPSDKLQVRPPNARHHNRTDALPPKSIKHQESLPELHNAPPADQPRKFSLPTSLLPPPSFPQRNVVSAVQEESDEPEAKPTPPHTPKSSRGKINEELKKIMQQRADGLQSSNKPVKRQPVVPPKGTK